jgi:acyl-CoA synthetase (AMP-forming)/AMP-acid ligase II
MYITQGIHRNLQQCQDRIAIEYQDVKYTYRELAERVAKLAGALRSFNVKDGDRVALMSFNSARYIEYIYAVPWAGGVLNPINFRWSAKEVAYSLDDSKTRVLIVDEKFAPLANDVKSKSRVLETVIYAGDGKAPAGTYSYESILEASDPVEDALRRGEDLLGVFYTGGTTGIPKGVMLGHNGYVASTLSVMLEGVAPEGVRFLHAAPMFHLADFAMLNGVTMHGGTHVIVPFFEPTSVLKVISEKRVTQCLLVPTMVQMLLDSTDFYHYDVSSLEHIVYGASPMPLDTIRTAMERMPNLQFIQAYGMTELSPVATVSGVGNHTEAGIKSGRIRTAGRPGIVQEVKIVDPEGNEAKRGDVREVIVRGPNVMQGYWGKPDETAAAVVNGWMYTGDGGYMDDDGYVYIVDPIKDMIISGGENIYSIEVENVVTQHPDVAQCAVIGIPDDTWGEAVHAVIVPVHGKKPSEEEIRNFCKKFIAGYKCPRSVTLVNALPLSGAGKILKTQLRKPYWENHKYNVN